MNYSHCPQVHAYNIRSLELSRLYSSLGKGVGVPHFTTHVLFLCAMPSASLIDVVREEVHDRLGHAVDVLLQHHREVAVLVL